jgi:hypothetical protein
MRREATSSPSDCRRNFSQTRRIQAWERKDLRLVRNSDNERLFLHPEFENFYVDEVNGAGAEEVPQYVPTKHELLQLVKYWHGRVLDNDFFRFQYGGSDSGEFRIARSAARRVRRAAAAIGQEAIDQALAKVREEFRAKVSDARLWDIYENGTEEHWAAVREESWREISAQYAAADLERLEQLVTQHPDDLIALVLHKDVGREIRMVLISPGDSELSSLSRASGKFETDTDKAKVRSLMVDGEFGCAGFLRITRRNGVLQFEFPGSEPGTVGRGLLESVTGEIKKLLQANAGKELKSA